MLDGVDLSKEPYEAARDSEALVVVTDWNEFKQLDMRRVKDAMAIPFLVDGRNIYDPELMRALGFEYYGVGRGRWQNGGPGAAAVPDDAVTAEA